jgi:hypothetical protein
MLAIEKKLHRLELSVSQTLQLSRAVSETVGQKIRSHFNLHQVRKETCIVPSWVSTKVRNFICQSILGINEGSIDAELAHPTLLIYDTAYYIDLYIVKIAGTRTVSYLDALDAEVDSYEVQETVIEISDPSDDGTDVVINPYSQVKAIIKLLEMGAAITNKVASVAESTIDANLGEQDLADVFSNLVRVAADHVDDKITLNTREHTSDGVTGVVTIINSAKGNSKPRASEATLVQTRDMSPGPWHIDASNAITVSLINVARNVNLRYYWKNQVYFYPDRVTLPGGLTQTGTIQLQLHLPTDTSIRKVEVDGNTVAERDGGDVWQVDGSLPYSYTGSIL